MRQITTRELTRLVDKPVRGQLPTPLLFAPGLGEGDTPPWPGDMPDMQIVMRGAPGLQIAPEAEPAPHVVPKPLEEARPKGRRIRRRLSRLSRTLQRVVSRHLEVQ